MAIRETDNMSGIIIEIGEDRRMKFIIPPSVLTSIPTVIADKNIRCSKGKFSFSAKT